MGEVIPQVYILGMNNPQSSENEVSTCLQMYYNKDTQLMVN